MDVGVVVGFVDVFEIVVIGNVSFVNEIVTGDVDKVVVVVVNVVVVVDKVVVVDIVVDTVVFGKVVGGKVVGGKVVVAVEIIVGVEAVTKPPSCPIPKKFMGEFGIFGSHRTGSLVNMQNLYHLTKKEWVISKIDGKRVNRLEDHKIVIVISYLFEEIMLLRRCLTVLTILLLAILLTNLLTLLLWEFLAGPNCFVHPHY